MNLQMLQLQVTSTASPSISSIQSHTALFSPPLSHFAPFNRNFDAATAVSSRRRRRRRSIGLVFDGAAGTEVRVGGDEAGRSVVVSDGEEEEEEEATPEDLEYVGQIKRVLELLRKNRDMLFGEVKLTIMIEDPREVERRRLLGIDDYDAPTREDLAAAVEDVNEGRVPKNRAALKMLAEEMTNWPNLEVEAPKKKPKTRSLYAKATDTGIDPKTAAKRLNIDWDTAAEIEEEGVTDDAEVPPAVGYGALYLVTAFPIIIEMAMRRVKFIICEGQIWI